MSAPSADTEVSRLSECSQFTKPCDSSSTARKDNAGASSARLACRTARVPATTGIAVDRRHTQISKFLSYVLRHQPDAIGITLDSQGWVAIVDLLVAGATNGNHITREELDFVVRNNNKQRFAISDDGTRIRASQGHSTEVDLGYASSVPPPVLYHGTAVRNLPSIRTSGLLKGNRHHVHLSLDDATAAQVGGRHGRPVVLIVRAGAMSAVGYEFFLSANGVWLTEHVPTEFIDFGSPRGSVEGEV